MLAHLCSSPLTVRPPPRLPCPRLPCPRLPAFHSSRAFAGYWSVKSTEETAMNGHWRLGPGAGLFEALTQQLGAVPILAEDLGVITTDVVNLR